MNLLLLGCGSIGTRRARILAKKGHAVWCSDPDIHRAVAVAKALEPRGHVYDGGPGDFDAALICTPPDSGRPEQVAMCTDLGVRALFVEKPLALDLSDVDEIRGYTALPPVTMGACNLRFCGGVSALRKTPKPWRLATFRMGQHAKHWSPTHTPVSLVLDSIHELDLAVHLQGPIASIRGYSETDVAEVSVHHECGGLSHVMLDRQTDPPIRQVRIQRRGDYDMLRLMTGHEMYVREIEHFIRCVETGEQTCNPLRDAAEVCGWALEVAA